jgi:hypothetical protein
LKQRRILDAGNLVDCHEMWFLESYPAAPRSETSEEPPIENRQTPQTAGAELFCYLLLEMLNGIMRKNIEGDNVSQAPAQLIKLPESSDRPQLYPWSMTRYCL